MNAYDHQWPERPRRRPSPRGARSRAWPLIASWGLWLLGSGWVGASATDEGELERLRAQAQRLEARLHELQRRQLDLNLERERLETELQLAEVRLREGEEVLARSAAAVAQAREAFEAAQKKLREAVERLQLQLGLLAALGRAGWAPLVLQALGEGRDLERRITLTLALVEEQKRRREEVASLTADRARALAELAMRQDQLQAATQEEQAKRTQLAATRSRVLGELARLEGERRRDAVALAELREAEARLERLWGRIAQEHPGRQDEVLLLRGGLPWPVEEGRIITRFGKRRDPRYGTVTVSNGLALEVTAGAEVRAVADGVVAYAQYLKGYGNLIILHHGGDVYSLYARLATMLVPEGRRVRMAAAVGRAGPSTEGEGNLYFEMRIGRRSEDPLVWLNPRGLGGVTAMGREGRP